MWYLLFIQNISPIYLLNIYIYLLPASIAYKRKSAKWL